MADYVLTEFHSRKLQFSEAGGPGNLEGKIGIMSTEEAEGGANLEICRDILSKPCISGVEGLCPFDTDHEMIMQPITPLPDRESQVVSSPSGRSEEADPGSVCETPAASIFDPFAPGPEGLTFAPKKKMLKKTFPPIQRQLNFDSCCDLKECSGGIISEETLEEERMLDIVGSDARCPEGKPGIGSEDTEDREDTDLCKSYSLKVGFPRAGDICLSKTINETLLGPLTPLPRRENLHSSSPSDQIDEGDSEFNCQTPRGSTFDPFVPVPEGLIMFAPKKKLLKETHVPVQRKLNFDSYCDSEESSVCNKLQYISDEEIFLATVYRSLLDVIISCQVEEFIGERLLADATLIDGSKTPTTLPLLNGIAESCPGAPTRPISKPRNFSVDIRRKLEF